MKHQPIIAVGLDPSLAASAIVAIRIASGHAEILAAETIVSSPQQGITERMFIVRAAAMSILERIQVGRDQLAVAVENFSRGSRFGREEMGMASIVLRLAAWDVFHIEPQPIGIAQAKTLVCPQWPGLSLRNWAEAGYERKFKRSLPDKASVMSGLQRRYGLVFEDDNQSDAACVTIAALKRNTPAIHDLIVTPED